MDKPYYSSRGLGGWGLGIGLLFEKKSRMTLARQGKQITLWTNGGELLIRKLSCRRGDPPDPRGESPVPACLA